MIFVTRMSSKTKNMKQPLRTSLLPRLGLVAGMAGFVFLMSCGGGDKSQDTTDATQPDSATTALMAQAKDVFGALPAGENPDSPLAMLGRKLYFETALSINDKMNCNSCHMLDKYGVDNLPTSPGHAGKTGNRNSPSVYNADLHFAQFWDGRAADLAEQAKGPILNPIEMGLPNEATAVKKIKAIADYAPMFSAAFPNEKDPITYNNIALAIQAFEKTLHTPSPFDKFVNGDATALNEEQKKGLGLFMEVGCTTCHIGVAFGGNMYQKFGLAKGPYWDYTGSKNHDKGRAEVTKDAADEFLFKVPSLRNIAMTAPYFHDGSVADLEKAIHVMGMTQLARDLKPEEVKSIATFLGSLTGEIPAHTKSL